MNKSYGSQDLQRNWYDVNKYLASRRWEENEVLTKLRRTNFQKISRYMN
jgi:hypothetical protein